MLRTIDQSHRHDARFDSGKGGASMAYQPCLAERIATYVAHEAMRKLSWCRMPELLLGEIEFEGSNVYYMQYRLDYPVWGDRSQKYSQRVHVNRGDKDTNVKWNGGQVRAYHFTNTIATYRDADFTITWDGDIPTIVISDFL